MRQIKKINKGWRLVANEGISKNALPVDTGVVSLQDVFTLDAGHMGENEYSGEECIYYKNIKLEDMPEADSIFLEIGAINSRCRVYFNGELLLSPCMCLPFRVELSDKILEENVLVIAVCEREISHASPPFMDFIDISGIFGDVNLIGVSRSHFSLLNSNNPPIKVTSFSSGIETSVDVEVFVNSNSREEMLKYIIYDNVGRVVSQKMVSVDKTRVKLIIENRKECFNGNNQYLCEVELLGEDTVLDIVGTSFYLGNEETYTEYSPLLMNGQNT